MFVSGDEDLGEHMCRQNSIVQKPSGFLKPAEVHKIAGRHNIQKQAMVKQTIEGRAET